MGFMQASSKTFTAFCGPRLVAQGPIDIVSRAAVTEQKATKTNVLVFSDETGKVVDLDLRDFSKEPTRGPGRPKLGVVAREVTLLPRHWDWLAEQPGGASVALRKLVEDARRTSGDAHRRRAAQESVYNFLTTTAGDEPGFEEALRALYRGEKKPFMALIKSWPGDIPAHALKLAEDAFPSS